MGRHRHGLTREYEDHQSTAFTDTLAGKQPQTTVFTETLDGKRLPICQWGDEAFLPNQASGSFTYFEGYFITAPRHSFRQSELRDEQGGHQPWRNDPLMVAQEVSLSLLPMIPPREKYHLTESADNKEMHLTTTVWEASYRLSSLAGNHAQVEVIVNTHPWYRLTLERPFGHHWYVTAVNSA